MKSSAFAIFTAIDAPRAVVQQLHEAGIPVIPVSEMTLEEVEPIAEDLGTKQAMIIEAGGAIARWTGKRWEVEPCGPPADILLDAIRDIEDRSGAMLQASLQHNFSMPFTIEKGAASKVAKAAAAIGFSLRRGQNFFHLCRACDEGVAFTRLRREIACDAAIAVGRSPIDAEFLTRAEISILVPGVSGHVDAELLAMVPHARVARACGTTGWTIAVDEATQRRARLIPSASPARRASRAPLPSRAPAEPPYA